MPDKPTFTITEIEKQVSDLMEKHANEEYLNSEESHDFDTSKNIKAMMNLFRSTLRRYIEGKEQEVEAMRKSVGDLFPDYKHEPTEEFAMQVQAKEYYNKAIDAILEGLKADKENL